jgi:hypothetical protein
MSRALAALLGCVFAFLALAVPFFGFWGLYAEYHLGMVRHDPHWVFGRIAYVIFLLALSLLFALVTFALWRYMFSGWQKTKLPPNHRTSLPPEFIDGPEKREPR